MLFALLQDLLAEYRSADIGLHLLLFLSAVQMGDVQILADDEQDADRNHCDQVFDRRRMFDDHLPCDRKQHHVDHRIDRVAVDHLDQLDTDDDQADAAA